MKKKTKLILNATLDKAISPPKKRDLSKLDSLLEEYHDASKPNTLKENAAHSSLTKTVDSTTPILVESSVESTARFGPVLVESTTPPNLRAGVHQKIVVDSRKTDRHNKNKVRIQPRIDKKILKRIKGFCEKKGFELGEYIEMLALHHLDLVDSTKTQKVESTDDKTIIFRANILIINLYETLTKKNRWTWNDDKEAFRFSESSIESIEVAMIRTIVRAKQPIRSFKYFVPEIELELAINVAPDLRVIQLASARKLFEMYLQGIPVEA